jgi:hypothetical protein
MVSWSLGIFREISMKKYIFFFLSTKRQHFLVRLKPGLDPDSDIKSSQADKIKKQFPPGFVLETINTSKNYPYHVCSQSVSVMKKLGSLNCFFSYIAKLF